MNTFLSMMDELLREKGHRRPWLAQETGINLSTINTWFASDRPPRVDVAFKLAQALEVPLEVLLTGERTPRRIYADTVLNDLVAYLETKDHEGLVRIEAILRTVEYMDLTDLARADVLDKITDRVIGEALSGEKGS